MTWNAEGEVHLIGLAADGVASVTVVYDDGTVQEVEASANVLDAVLKDSPSRSAGTDRRVRST